MTTEATPTPVGTILADGQTGPPPPTATATIVISATSQSFTPVIPITGENVVSMQCQFCVEDETHAVLVFPEFAYFDVVSTSPVSCLTADVVNGQRILICRGAQSTSFFLNICSDPANCLEFPVALQACPLLPLGTDLATLMPSAPIFLTPINTLNPPDEDDPPPPDNTPVPSLAPTQTIVPITPTSPPPSGTTAPPPTQTTEPPPTQETEPPPPTDPPTEEPTEPVN